MRSAHPRITARPVLTILAVCLALSSVFAGSAAAASREHQKGSATAPMRGRSVAERRMRSLVARHGAFKPFLRAGPSIPHTLRYFEAYFEVDSGDANYPTWDFVVEALGWKTFVFISTQRPTPDGYQQQEYDWFKQVPRADVVRSRDLSTFSIHTGTELGSFGAIDMTFTPSRSRTHKFYCPKTKALLGTVRQSSGALDGTFSFTPAMTGLPSSVTATHANVRLGREVATGATCSYQFPGNRCFTRRSFTARDGLGAHVSTDVGYGYLQARSTSVVDGVTVSESVQFEPNSGPFGSPDNPVTLTRTDLTIDGDMMGDLFAGTIAFDRSGSAVIHTSPRCSTAKSTFVWREGSLNLLLDAGTVSLTGSGLQGRLVWVRQAG